MNLVAISWVKNEVDIIEAFIRHHSHYFNKHIVIDDGSSDGTYEVLRSLEAAGLPLVLTREPSVGYQQSRSMTRLLHMAVDHFHADWIMPLDADEFVEPEEGATLAQTLQSRPPELLTVSWDNFVWRPEDDERKEPNPVVRMRLRMPATSDLGKVVVPARLVVGGGVELAQGSHSLLRNGQALPAQPLSAVRLCHFPIRSVEQYAGKVAVGYLQYSAKPGWDRNMGRQYIEPFRLLAQGVDQLAQSMTATSRRYGQKEEIGQPQEAPLRYQGGPLSLTRARGSMLANVLHCAEAIANRLGEQAQQKKGIRGTLATSTGALVESAARAIAREAAPSVTNTSPAGAAATKHKFQSFWSGGALTPYEKFCLKSFIDCGHAFDLYTFDVGIDVPSGVRICDASELLGREELFVYEDGFGKGSPSAFSNLFRYKLLTEKGGWWVDTDVVCLCRDIPAFDEFFAHQEAHSIAAGILFFAPRHPLMARCLEEAKRLGRSVRWGETGPFLLTRVVKEFGCEHRARASSICYPVHYSLALDVMRPSKTGDLRERTASALFVHLWNAMFEHGGVQKTNLPPKGSILRQWIEQHAVDGWQGEYDEETLEHTLALHEKNRGLSAAVDQLRAELADRTVENERLRARTQAILASTSWQLTEPLRAATRRLRRLLQFTSRVP
jgi:hypothetical protein